MTGNLPLMEDRNPESRPRGRVEARLMLIDPEKGYRNLIVFMPVVTPP